MKRYRNKRYNRNRMNRIQRGGAGNNFNIRINKDNEHFILKLDDTALKFYSVKMVSIKTINLEDITFIENVSNSYNGFPSFNIMYNPRHSINLNYNTEQHVLNLLNAIKKKLYESKPLFKPNFIKKIIPANIPIISKDIGEKTELLIESLYSFKTIIAIEPINSEFIIVRTSEFDSNNLGEYLIIFLKPGNDKVIKLYSNPDTTKFMDEKLFTKIREWSISASDKQPLSEIIKTLGGGTFLHLQSFELSYNQLLVNYLEDYIRQKIYR